MQQMTEPGIPKAIEGPAAVTISGAAPSSGNNVYFYESVNSQSTLNMIRQIKECEMSLNQHRLTYDIHSSIPRTPIYLHIQSPGGDMFAAMAAADQLQHIESPVISIVEGYCASAATLISMACTKRWITPHSHMLIHQFFSVVWGTYEQFKDDMKLQDTLIEQLVAFYASRSKLKSKAVRKLLKHDSWFDARTSVKHGLADDLY